MNLHLEIGTVPMHFLTMDTIEIRDADSAYKYAFTLIDMLTNYVFVIPVKDICSKTSVHKLHKLWKAHAAEIRKNRSKKDNPKIDKDPPLKLGDRVLIMNYNSHGLDPKILWRLEDLEIQLTDRL